MEDQLQGWLDLGLTWGMRVISALLILIAGWIIGGTLRRKVENVRRLDGTLRSFLGGFIKYAVLAVSIVAVLAQFGVQTASLITVLGAAGLAIGLALQGTLSNIAAGVMLLILRPFGLEDYIEVNDIGGTVKSLGLFGTELATPDNCYVFIPNSSVWGNNITNYTRHSVRRQDIKAGISYDDDINKAFSTVMGVLKADDRIVQEGDRKPQVMVCNMGDFSIDLIIRIWTQTPDYWAVKWDITKGIKEAFDKNGITIPFPTQIEILRKEDIDTKKEAA